MECPNCKSDHIDDSECPSCRGWGMYMHPDDMRKCEQCNGTGYIFFECFACGHHCLQANQPGKEGGENE